MEYAMTVTNKAVGALICAALMSMAPVAAIADPDDAHHPKHAPRAEHAPHTWHGDIHRFPEHDLPRWRVGHWQHVDHDGRFGWWWVIPAFDIWYLYSAPVYPYPNPYIPPIVGEQVPTLAPTPAPNAPPPPAQYWYYCESAKGYYPYVTSCPEGWQRVPATPPEAPAQ